MGIGSWVIETAGGWEVAEGVCMSFHVGVGFQDSEAVGDWVVAEGVTMWGAGGVGLVVGDEWCRNPAMPRHQMAL